jgi:hypothetical protein
VTMKLFRWLTDEEFEARVQELLDTPTKEYKHSRPTPAEPIYVHIHQQLTHKAPHTPIVSLSNQIWRIGTRKPTN